MSASVLLVESLNVVAVLRKDGDVTRRSIERVDETIGIVDIDHFETG